jgi:hypothetical protein
MKEIIKSLLIPALLGGAWGIFAFLVSSILLSKISFMSFLFYPILFGGITAIVSTVIQPTLAFTRALIVGSISGFIYHVLSSFYPFLSSVLVGASIGGGLVAERENLKNVLNGLTSIMKGAFIFPVSIFLGQILARVVTGIFDSHFLLWFFWGGWLSLVICLIPMPLFNVEDADENLLSLTEIDEFKSEAQQILRDLNQMELRFK